MRNILGLGFLIEILHRLAAELLMLGQIEIPARGDAFQFLGAEGELELDVHRGFGVVGQFLLGLPVFDERVAAQADALIPLEALLDPILVPKFPAPSGLRDEGRGTRVGQTGDRTGHLLDDFIGPDEKLQFHLLEFTRAKSEVARVDLVAKGFADLANTEGNSLPGNIERVCELNEDGVRGFGTEVGDILLALDRTDVGLEYDVERPELGQQPTRLRVIPNTVAGLFGSLS